MILFVCYSLIAVGHHYYHKEVITVLKILLDVYIIVCDKEV